MKTVITSSGRSRYRYVKVPTTWEEGLAMLEEAAGPEHDVSGGDAYRQSVALRVVFGLFRDDTTPNATTAMNYLLQKICERRGAGLDDPQAVRKDPGSGGGSAGRSADSGDRPGEDAGLPRRASAAEEPTASWTEDYAGI